MHTEELSNCWKQSGLEEDKTDHKNTVRKLSQQSREKKEQHEYDEGRGNEEKFMYLRYIFEINSTELELTQIGCGGWQRGKELVIVLNRVMPFIKS